MITALLVVLFAFALILVGFLANSAGYMTGHSDGYDAGYDENEEYLEERIDVLSAKLECSVAVSDQYKRKYEWAELLRKINFVEYKNASTKLAEVVKINEEGCGIIKNLIELCEGFDAKVKLDAEDNADQIDGLTVDLAMAEAERDAAKATIEKILSAKVSAKTTAEIKRIVAAQ